MVVVLAIYLVQAAIAVALFVAQLLWVVGDWSFRALAAIPDIVHELRRRRQAARLARRADELTALDGIGPKPLQRIRAYGVVCERR